MIRCVNYIGEKSYSEGTKRVRTETESLGGVRRRAKLSVGLEDAGCNESELIELRKGTRLLTLSGVSGKHKSVESKT